MSCDHLRQNVAIFLSKRKVLLGAIRSKVILEGPSVHLQKTGVNFSSYSSLCTAAPGIGSMLAREGKSQLSLGFVLSHCHALGLEAAF